MSNYIFFIGGSGARIYKSFLHCSASGIIQTEQVKVVLLDADVKNKASEECIELYRQYCIQRTLLNKYAVEKKRRDVGNIFKSDIQMYVKEVISPVCQKDSVYLEQIAQGDEMNEQVMQWFYTETERKQDLKNGFYAHPNIGCVFFQTIENEYFKQCLSDIQADLNNGENVQIVLIGSVFGGTGASGIPSVLKLIYESVHKGDAHEKIDNLHCCGVLLTPYFKVQGSADAKDKLIINDKDFYFNTIEALKYYRLYSGKKQNGQEMFHSIYIIGQKELDIVNSKYASGGEQQKNKAHIMEFYAAMAIGDFLENPKENGIFVYQKPNTLDNQALSEELHALTSMARAQVILANSIFPYVKQERERKNEWDFMVPQWYKVYHINEENNLNTMESLHKYSISMLEWACEIQSKILNDNECILDPSVHLFGNAIDYIRQNMDEIREGNVKEKTDKEIQRKFNEIIDTASNIEFLLDKTVLILSCLGVVPKTLAAAGAAGLLLRLIELVRKKK